MKTNRRDFLKGIGVFVAGLAAGAVKVEEPEIENVKDSESEIKALERSENPMLLWAPLGFEAEAERLFASEFGGKPMDAVFTTHEIEDDLGDTLENVVDSLQDIGIIADEAASAFSDLGHIADLAAAKIPKGYQVLWPDTGAEPDGWRLLDLPVETLVQISPPDSPVPVHRTLKMIEKM